ncbi:MAG: AraC family transcriptional regulator [Myxococcota bacterium]
MDDDPSVGQALRSVLRSVQLDTSVMSRAHLTMPFAIASQTIPRAIFHAVVEGACTIDVEGHPTPLTLEAGDVALLTHGDAHVIRRGDHAATAPLATLPMQDDGTCVRTLTHGGNGELTRIICGSFELRHAASDVMLAALPRALHARGKRTGGLSAWLDTTIDLLSAELDRGAPAADAMVARFTDVLVMHIIQACVDQAPVRGGGWLSALRDERIGRALATIHHDPAGQWTAATLASRAGMSRSSFFARFSELVGEPPARYVARWRVWVAADLMERERLSTGELADRVGYASEDAFSRVFKRIMGISPVEFRRQSLQPAM